MDTHQPYARAHSISALRLQRVNSGQQRASR
jgi:hypothetical protein